MRPRDIVPFIAIATLASIAACTVSDPADDPRLVPRPPPPGAVPAAGGGWCCKADSPIPCEPGYIGGWVAEASSCPTSPDNNGDTIFTMVGTDQHGCTYLFPPANCSNCLSPCMPDASTDAVEQ